MCVVPGGICEVVVSVRIAVCGAEVGKVTDSGDQLQTVLGVPGGEFDSGGANRPAGSVQLSRITPVNPLDGVSVTV